MIASRSSGGGFDIALRLKEVADVDRKSLEAGFWDDAKAAQSVMKVRTRALEVIEPFQAAERDMAEIGDFLELLKSESDPDLAAELRSKLDAMEKTLGALEFRRMLSGEADPNNAILSINAGSGGTEAQDWAEMLYRMYLRYCERRGWKVELVEETPGEEAGIKSATVNVIGEYAYGYLKAEAGVHRLVRISPFDANKRRHTSFAAVNVIPELDDSIEIEIQDKDLRVDTFRAGGAGGQHQNKTDSAVRYTHIPTGTSVVCRSERSQIQNRAVGLKILKAKLYDLEMQKRNAERDKAAAQKKENAWGSQIRSYVLQPYRMVKDLRTGVTAGNPQAVLDGDLDEFITAFLLGIRREGAGQDVGDEE